MRRWDEALVVSRHTNQVSYSIVWYESCAAVNVIAGAFSVAHEIDVSGTSVPGGGLRSLVVARCWRALVSASEMATFC